MFNIPFVHRIMIAIFVGLIAFLVCFVMDAGYELALIITLGAIAYQLFDWLLYHLVRLSSQ